MTRHGREERRRLEYQVGLDRERAAAARDECDAVAGRVECLQADQDAFERFCIAEDWRHAEIDRLRCQLDQHWVGVVVSCVAADDPLAYGIDRLRHARVTLDAEWRAIDAAIPRDRAREWDLARRQLPQVTRQRHEALQALADSQTQVHDAGRRRWGRHDHDAITDARARLADAQQQADEATAVESRLRERLAGLADQQRARGRQIADVAGRRSQTAEAVAQIEDALERTRTDRVSLLVDDPPGHLVARLGPPPGSAAGRAVWCHHALGIEAELDRHDGDIGGRSAHDDRARQEIAVADKLLPTEGDQPGTATWAELAGRASSTLDQLRHAQRQHLADRRLQAQEQQQPRAWVDQAIPPTQYGPEL